jgi:glycosyltransferase involved in cell wall biosynthesis
VPEPEPSIAIRLPQPPQPTTRFGGVSIIVPCYNEVDCIAATVRKLSDTMLALHRPYELIVVDDGSNDATPHELASCAYERHLRVLRNERNRGYGFSLKRAVADAQYETVVIIDADGTYPIAAIGALLDAFDGADMVVAARTGNQVHVPLARRPAKWALRKLAAYLTQTEIPDLNSGLRVLKRNLIRKFLPLLPDGFSFTTTITLALLTHGCTVKYVPINYAKRVGRSSIRPLRDTINFLSLIVRTVVYFRPLRIFAPASMALFALAIAVALITKLAWGQLADITSVTLVIASVQLLAIGLLADLVDKRSPSYT